MEVLTLGEEKIEEQFFCQDCDLRVDLCTCDRFIDRGCWDCGPGCVVNQRRKAKKALEEAFAGGIIVPKSRPGEIFEETKSESRCCKVRLKKLMRKTRTPSGLIDVYIAHICPNCNLMYYQSL